MSYTLYDGDNSQKIKRCIDYFNKLILTDLKAKDIKCWVAGGAIRSYFAHEKINDIDLFFPDRENAKKAYDFFMNDKYSVIFENDNVTKVKKGNGKVFDIINRHFLDIYESLDNFDFTVVCAGINDNDKLICNDNFFIDLSSKSLIINSLPFPLSTLQRLQKYIKRGYHICNGGLLELSKAIMAINLEDKHQNSLEFYPDGTPRFMRWD